MLDFNTVPFLLFVGERHYPSGGWHDFNEAFDNVHTATATGERLIAEENNFYMDWYHVVDLRSGRIVAGGGSAYGTGNQNPHLNEEN